MAPPGSTRRGCPVATRPGRRSRATDTRLRRSEDETIGRAIDGSIALTVNGQARQLAGDPSRILLFVLRDELGLTGTKPACGEGVCGACTVLADGQPIRSCVTPLDGVAGRSLTTIEGLGDSTGIGGALHTVQQAFLAEGAFQCGYCTPGMMLASAALLERDPRPTDEAIA